MHSYAVQIRIPEQEVELEVFALDAAEATRIALRDVTPLEVVHLSTAKDDEDWMV